MLWKTKAEQLWSSHQVTSLNEMQSVAGDALGNQRIGLIDEATAELPRHQMQCHEHLQGYQRDVRRHLSEVRHQVQAQQVARKENVEHLRHELSHSLADGSRYQNLYTTKDLVLRECISKCDKSVITWLFIVAAWKEKRKNANVQSVLLKRKWRRDSLIEVNPGCRTTEVEYSTGPNSSLCGRKFTALSKLERSTEDVAQLQACCLSFGITLTPRSVSEIKDICQELEWMFMEERRREICCHRKWKSGY